MDAAFAYAGLDVEKHVRIDQRYFIPTEVEVLQADSRNSEQKLGWKARIKFTELMKIMVDVDMRALGLDPVGEGDEIISRKFPGRL